MANRKKFNFKNPGNKETPANQEAEANQAAALATITEEIEQLRQEVYSVMEVLDPDTLKALEALQGLESLEALQNGDLPHLLEHMKPEYYGMLGQVQSFRWRDLYSEVEEEREALQKGYDQACEVCGWLRKPDEDEEE